MNASHESAPRMDNQQIALARDALGLDGRRKVSYRNRFVCGRHHDDYDDWTLMVVDGFAKRRDGRRLPFGGDDCFYLTLAGAKQALLLGERLCREDFPTQEETAA